MERKDTHPHTALVKRKRIKMVTMTDNQAEQSGWKNEEGYQENQEDVCNLTDTVRVIGGGR